MPIASDEPDRQHATRLASLAVVGTRLNAPDRVERLLRALCVLGMGAAPIDEPEALAAATPVDPRGVDSFSLTDTHRRRARLCARRENERAHKLRERAAAAALRRAAEGCVAADELSANRAREARTAR
jgi:hypothetical protein